VAGVGHAEVRDDAVARQLQCVAACAPRLVQLCRFAEACDRVPTSSPDEQPGDDQLDPGAHAARAGRRSICLPFALLWNALQPQFLNAVSLALQANMNHNNC
jgi:hypothetical protein